MKSLSMLGARVGCEWPELPVEGLSLSSQGVAAGWLFCALPGTRVHGLSYAQQALARGAVAVAYDPLGAPAELPSASVPFLAVPDLRLRLGELAAAFFADPAEALELVGVTGTDGKTSVVHLYTQMQRLCGRAAASLGTLGLDLGDGPKAGTHTTPDAIQLQSQFALARDRGIRTLAMEVSSHALAQGRVASLPFRHVALTTLGRDHLDYHADVEAYHATKLGLLNWPGLRSIHLNGADANVTAAATQSPLTVQPQFYGPWPDAGWKLEAVEADARGLRMRLCHRAEPVSVRAPLYGDFNAGNILAAASLCEATGVPAQELVSAIPRLQTVPGRMEAHRGAGRVAVIDYAHTPDALQAALAALRAHQPRQLHCVFGCGGDRDRGKRPLMAAAAQRGADRVVMTDDNPRGEDPEQIFADARAGFSAAGEVHEEHDRAAAITRALDGAAAGDIVLVAGKGHEDYQLIAGERRHFSDREVIQKLLGGVGR